MTARILNVFAIAWLGALMAACSSPVPEDSLIRGPAKLGGFSTTVGEPKDFVKENRVGEGDYIPVGFTPAKRAITPKTQAELAAYEKNLNEKRVKTEGFAMRPAPAMKPINQPNTLPPVPGSTLDPTNPENQAGDDNVPTAPVPPKLQPKRVQNP